MNAVILAAGVGKRLRPFTAKHPKCLLTFGGKTLLHRHVDMLQGLGVRKVSVVTGHLADQVATEISKARFALPVELIHNPQYDRGSALSLLSAEPAYRAEPAIIMDADILFDRRVLERLLAAGSVNCLAVDDRLADTGEEVKVIVGSNGHVLELGKRIAGRGRLVGESVGIFKFSAEANAALARALNRAVNADPDSEYETVINDVLSQIEMGYVTVGDLAWLEIDFMEDVERAQAQIWPAILRSESAPARPGS